MIWMDNERYSAQETADCEPNSMAIRLTATLVLYHENVTSNVRFSC